MALSNVLLPEFDHEMANTRKTLERVPDDKFAWKPHEKSMPMGKLASHLADIPHWVGDLFRSESFDVAPPGGQPYQPFQVNSRAEVLAVFDKNIAAARKTISEASDESMFKTWSLLSGGKAAFTMPRIAVLRSFIMSHIIHHRAQLGVYLRLNDVPVPAIYGPSADEAGM